MGNRIDQRLSRLKRYSRKALVTYVVAGDPDFETSARVVWELERSGADIIELGMPFSDPLADGVTIQAASTRALRRGVNLLGISNLVEKIRRKSDSAGISR